MPTATCPHCYASGALGGLPGRYGFGFETRGHANGRPVLRCTTCGSGAEKRLLGLKPIPGDRWAAMEQRWIAEFPAGAEPDLYRLLSAVELITTSHAAAATKGNPAAAGELHRAVLGWVELAGTLARPSSVVPASVGLRWFVVGCNAHNLALPTAAQVISMSVAARAEHAETTRSTVGFTLSMLAEAAKRLAGEVNSTGQAFGHLDFEGSGWPNIADLRDNFLAA